MLEGVVSRNTFENIVGKGENAYNQNFLLFPQCFLPFPKQISIFYSQLFCRLQMLSILDQSEIFPSGKELKGKKNIPLPKMVQAMFTNPEILRDTFCNNDRLEI